MCYLATSSLLVIIIIIIIRRRRRSLAGAQHLLEGGLLSRADGQAVGGLDLDPGGGVVAVDAGDGGLPLVGAGVALLGVGGAGDGPELGTVDVVGEGLTLGGGPSRRTGLGLLLGALGSYR